MYVNLSLTRSHSEKSTDKLNLWQSLHLIACSICIKSCRSSCSNWWRIVSPNVCMTCFSKSLSTPSDMSRVSSLVCFMYMFFGPLPLRALSCSVNAFTMSILACSSSFILTSYLFRNRFYYIRFFFYRPL